MTTREPRRADRPTPPQRREGASQDAPDPVFAGHRIGIEQVAPEIEGGRFHAKAVLGDQIEIAADILCDGTAFIAANILYKADIDSEWQCAAMGHWDNDRWRGHIPATAIGRMRYTIEAWIDSFAGWRRDCQKKSAAKADIRLDLIEGRLLLEHALPHTEGADHGALEATLRRIKAAGEDLETIEALLLSEETRTLMNRWQKRRHYCRYEKEVPIWVDRRAARYGAWYELMPRSQSDAPGRHGTFDDVIGRLPDIREMGFDVLYLLPIHPIGRINRKGRNNHPMAEPGEPGSPYAIGAAEGGHTAIHPELGTIEDFRRLLRAAHDHGLEIAIDFAIQCSPDHPWLRNNPDWFAWRPDGSLRYAENPPKKYEDIVNVEFYGKAFPDVWFALRDVVLYWIEQGVKIFRVDNPHTKPFPFWEWLIGSVQKHHPEAVFLSEAFTRPKIMKRLAKLGFSQSYTYFTWRETKRELTDYLTELASAPAKHFFRPNFFTNTPDINPHHLQNAPRAAFQIRAALAATLSSAYGIYSGFELCEGTPIPEKEEYLNSEKYELKIWDWNRPGNIRDYIAVLNRIRRENPAFHDFANLRFYNAFDENVLYYGKFSAGWDNVVLIAVNLDPLGDHGCSFEVPLWEFGLNDDAVMPAEDLIAGHSFSWQGKIQHLHLDPARNPCAIWRLNPPRMTQDSHETAR